jgi:hypothetical protein
MGADSGFRLSVPRLSVIPVGYGGTSCRACDWEADGAVGGRLQRPAAEGHRGRWRRVRARRPTRSPRARGAATAAIGALWCEPDPGRSRRLPPQSTRGRHEPVPPPAYCGARSEPCCAAGALLPALLLATAADPGRGSSRRACPAGPQVAGTVFWRVSRGAILLPVMAGGAAVEIALSMLVHFAAAKRKVAWHLSRVALRPGTGRSKMCIKQLYVLTVRGLYIN